MTSNVQLIFGGGSFIDPRYTLEVAQEALDILQEEGVKEIDTARIYGTSEEILGNIGAASRFTIHTKYPGGLASGGLPTEPSSKDKIIAVAQQSLDYLKTDQVDVYFLHAPERNGSLEEILAGINALHQAGKFKRFGLSNFLPEEVEEVVRVAREKNYILPSVYQGNYSAVARRLEADVIPVLRKHNISIQAYSPIAGGFLTKDVDQILAGGEGRWDPDNIHGKIYRALYAKSGMFDGLRLWEKIATESGIPKAELAYRWVVYHSALKGEFGDGIVFGATSLTQLRGTLAGVKNGPLSEEVAQQIEEVWKIVEADAPLDNFNSLIGAVKKN